MYNTVHKKIYIYITDYFSHYYISYVLILLYLLFKNNNNLKKNKNSMF